MPEADLAETHMATPAGKVGQRSGTTQSVIQQISTKIGRQYFDLLKANNTWRGFLEREVEKNRTVKRMVKKKGAPPETVEEVETRVVKESRIKDFEEFLKGHFDTENIDDAYKSINDQDEFKSMVDQFLLQEFKMQFGINGEVGPGVEIDEPNEGWSLRMEGALKQSSEDSVNKTEIEGEVEKAAAEDEAEQKSTWKDKNPKWAEFQQEVPVTEEEHPVTIFG